MNGQSLSKRIKLPLLTKKRAAMVVACLFHGFDPLPLFEIHWC